MDERRLGRFMRDTREAHNPHMTQETFGASLNPQVSQQTVSRWEDDDNPASPRAKRYGQIARILGVPVSELVDRASRDGDEPL